MMAFKICPRCFKGHKHDEGCKTPTCAELQASPSYLRDDLEGQLHIAQTYLAEGDTSADWAAEVKELSEKLVKFDAHRGAAAFKQ